MNEVNCNNLFNSLLGLRHVSMEIRQLIEPAGTLERLAGVLPLSVRWQRSQFRILAKQLAEQSGKPLTEQEAAEFELRILVEALVKQVQHLPVSRDWITQAERIGRNLSLASATAINTTLTQIVELHAHLMGELKQGRFYVVPANQVELMADGARPFGDEVHVRFREATKDIAASGRCLALGEWTACVFHSMRVLEHGLRALAGYVGVTMVEVEQWKVVIDQIEKEIRAFEASPKGAAKTEKVQFCSEAASQFRYFKDAWRNHVAHARESYDSQEANSIWIHTKEFMQSLAQHL